MTLDRRTVAGLVEDALAEVFDQAVVSGLREDSALSAVGMTPADAVCVADALDLAARRAGLDCALDDADFAVDADLTVADLIDAVMKGMTEEDTP